MFFRSSNSIQAFFRSLFSPCGFVFNYLLFRSG